MELYEMIYRRKSVRSFENKPVDAEILKKINDFTENIHPLYPDIKVCTEIVDRENIKCILPWVTKQLIAIYSESKEGALENVGFMFQQLDLYMQSIGLGVCWLGMGRMNSKYVLENKNDNMKFVIMLAFGYPKGDATRADVNEFKRRALTEISDVPDEKLEPARLAPSSVNSQPWYFTHEGETIHTYCAKQGIFSKILGDMNRIDIGICLAHMYVANSETFCFFKADNPKEIKDYAYMGSFTI